MAGVGKPEIRSIHALKTIVIHFHIYSLRIDKGSRCVLTYSPIFCITLLVFVLLYMSTFCQGNASM